MKTLNLTQELAVNQRSAATNQAGSVLISSTMKKLSNVSPFLLLLLPVFIMMIFTFSISVPAQENESTLKTTTKAAGSIVNITSKFLR